ncbi:MAG TPA: hypothetical protein VJV79_20760 [Polyangiaceae bacterium]|nr:hypothetical protein [Polyangiaceae bacterium]
MAASSKSRGARRPTVHRYLTQRRLEEHWPAIEAALEAKRDVWQIQGWSIQGKAPRLRVVVKVPYRRVTPRAPVSPLRIPGSTPFWLKVGVEATFFSGFGKVTSRGHSRGRSRHSGPLVSGAPIEVSSGGRSRCGIAAVLTLDDSPFLLTCGHNFNANAGKVFLPGSHAPIARLTRNLFDDSSPLDAAICELTDRGIELLDASADADTWFSTVHTPEAADNDESAVFWPTSEDDPDPIELQIVSFSVRFDPLFGPHGPKTRFIQMQLSASEGDSGSALAFGGALYGLCSGTAGPSAYFTAIADVVQSLRSDFGSIKPWQPD